MTTYYRIKGNDEWHWVPACQHFDNVVAQEHQIYEANHRPSYGELCNECKAKEVDDIQEVD